MPFTPYNACRTSRTNAVFSNLSHATAQPLPIPPRAARLSLCERRRRGGTLDKEKPTTALNNATHASLPSPACRLLPITTRPSFSMQPLVNSDTRAGREGHGTAPRTDITHQQTCAIFWDGGLTAGGKLSRFRVRLHHNKRHIAAFLVSLHFIHSLPRLPPRLAMTFTPALACMDKS